MMGAATGMAFTSYWMEYNGTRLLQVRCWSDLVCLFGRSASLLGSVVSSVNHHTILAISGGRTRRTRRGTPTEATDFVPRKNEQARHERHSWQCQVVFVAISKPGGACGLCASILTVRTCRNQLHQQPREVRALLLYSKHKRANRGADCL